MDYHKKYLKYKNKYVTLREQSTIFNNILENRKITFFDTENKNKYIELKNQIGSSSPEALVMNFSIDNRSIVLSDIKVKDWVYDLYKSTDNTYTFKCVKENYEPCLFTSIDGKGYIPVKGKTFNITRDTNKLIFSS